MIQLGEIDWILFDLDNTILSFCKSSRKAFDKLLDHLEVVEDKNIHYQIYSEINHQLWADREMGLISHEELKTSRWSLYFEKIQIDYSAEEANQLYFENLTSSVDFVDGAMELLEAVKGKFKTMIITNGLSEVQWPRMESSGILDYFDHVVISDEIGHAKPQREFFSHCHELMHRPDKNRVLVIGDTQAADIRGANNFGYKSCWFNHDKLPTNHIDIPDWTVQELSEIIHGIIMV